jgi:hypothetical protein
MPDEILYEFPARSSGDALFALLAAAAIAVVLVFLIDRGGF